MNILSSLFQSKLLIKNIVYFTVVELEGPFSFYLFEILFTSSILQNNGILFFSIERLRNLKTDYMEKKKAREFITNKIMRYVVF